MEDTLTIEDVHAKQLSDADYYRRLNELNLGGCIRTRLQAGRASEDENHRVILLRDSTGQIAAWAMLYHLTFSGYADYWEFQVFVPKSLRRNGLGTKLLQHAMPLTGGEKLYCTGWDITSKDFFESFGQSISLHLQAHLRWAA
jgi:hypothetical protein